MGIEGTQKSIIQTRIRIKHEKKPAIALRECLKKIIRDL